MLAVVKAGDASKVKVVCGKYPDQADGPHCWKTRKPARRYGAITSAPKKINRSPRRGDRYCLGAEMLPPARHAAPIGEKEKRYLYKVAL